MQIAALDDIAGKVAAGVTLTAAEAEQLAGTGDIVSLGMMADEVRRRLHGTATTFVRVVEVSVAAVLAGPVTIPPSAREVRLVGPFQGIEPARAAVQAVRRTTTLPLGGFDLADLQAAAAADGHHLGEWLRALHGDGLEMIAAASVDRLADPGAFRTTVENGLAVARLVVHGRTDADPLDIVRRVAALQRAAGPVRAFAPIPRHAGAEPTTGYEDVKRVALARILLDGVTHVQVDWTLHGPKLAQVCLAFGASDVDNVSAVDTTAEGPRRAPLEEIRRNIRAAGLDPVERDARFVPVG